MVRPAAPARNRRRGPNRRPDENVPGVQPHAVAVWVPAFRGEQQVLRLSRGRHTLAGGKTSV